VDASGPLFQAGLLSQGQYRQARAYWDEARLQYQQTVLQAFHEVSGQLYTRQKYEEARLQQAVPSPPTRMPFSSPPNATAPATPTYFEVLDAQQQLFPDENALARTQLEPAPHHRPPYKSLGGGWNLAHETAP
jgi:multidrug efflux system outer membrane protein